MTMFTGKIGQLAANFAGNKPHLAWRGIGSGRTCSAASAPITCRA
jgi:hypothetical protein